jgi:CheY-like chemotaxis protein
MDELDFTRDILLAEDDKDDVMIFELALNDINIPYVMRHAANGDVLFVLLKDKIPYILFLDINMPCKDGVSCIIEIRKNKEYDRLPIIMYTAHLSKKIVEECFREGANLYLAKLTEFNKLTEKLKQIFSIDWQSHMYFPPSDQFMC